MTKIEIPLTVETPLHAIDGARYAIRDQWFGDASNPIVTIETRVLRWLCADAETLNTLVARTHYEANR